MFHPKYLQMNRSLKDFRTHFTIAKHLNLSYSNFNDYFICTPEYTDTKIGCLRIALFLYHGAIIT